MSVATVGTLAGAVNLDTAAAPSTGVMRDAAGGIAAAAGTFTNVTTATRNESVSAKTATYTLGSSETVVTGDATGGAFAVNLPTAVVAGAGRVYTVKKTDSSGNAVTLTRAGSDLIDGATTKALTSQYQSARVISDGVSNWWIV